MLVIAAVAGLLIWAASNSGGGGSEKVGRDYLCEDIRGLVTTAQSGGSITGFQSKFSQDSSILRGEGDTGGADAAADFARSTGAGLLPNLSELPDGYCTGHT